MSDSNFPEFSVETQEHDAVSPRESGPSRPPLRRQIGSYAITDLLGEGGMGIVYLAEQQNPRRTVALKVIRPGLISARLLRRFEHESEVLGRLQHPNIAQIYEAGTFETEGSRQPFYAMEVVRGVPLTDYARAKRLSVRERVQLMIKVCCAVAYAHQRGVIHRDLKPANILVDAGGAPKVLDFGVARRTGTGLDRELALTLETSPGQIVGTLQYMAPEQAGGELVEGTDSRAGDVDTRADVYSLGVLLYELLTGTPPYSVGGRALPDAVRVVREHEPIRLGSVDKSLRGDLERVVGKALEKDRDRRYTGASALEADLRRYLADEPVAAHPPSAWYQVRKLARRHKAWVVGVAAVVVALLAGIVATASQAHRANRATASMQWERDSARRAESSAEVARDAARRVARRAAALGLAATSYESARKDDPHLDLPERMKPAQVSLLIAAEAVKLASADGSSAPTHVEQAFHDALTGFGGQAMSCDGCARTLAFSLDGQQLLGAGNAVAWWGIGSGTPFAKLDHAGMAVLSANSQWLAAPFFTISGTSDRFHIFDVNNRADIATIIAPDPPRHSSLWHMAISSKGRWFAAASDDVSVAHVWKVNANRSTERFQLAGIDAVVANFAISPDARWLVAALRNGRVLAWELTRSNPAADPLLLSGIGDTARPIAVSPDSRWLAIAGESTQEVSVSAPRANTSGIASGVRLFDLSDAAPVTATRILIGHTMEVDQLLFSPDSSRLASIEKIRGNSFESLQQAAPPILIWTLLSPGPPLNPLADTGNGAPAATAHFDRLGRWVFLGGSDGRVVFCDLKTQAAAFDGVRRQTNLSHIIVCFASSLDGRWLAAGHFDGAISLYDLSIENPEHISPIRLRGHAAQITQLVFGPGGHHLATSAEDGTVRLFDLTALQIDGNTMLTPLPARLRQSGMGLTLDRDALVTAHADGLLRFHDLSASQRRPALALPGHIGAFERSGFFRIAIDKQRRRIMIPGSPNSARIWKVKESRAVADFPLVLPSQEEPITSVAVQGSVAVTATKEGVVRIWDLSATPLTAKTLRFSGQCFVDLSPDGRWMAVTSKTITLWDLAGPQYEPKRVLDTKLGSQGVFGVGGQSLLRCMVTPFDNQENPFYAPLPRIPGDRQWDKGENALLWPLGTSGPGAAVEVFMGDSRARMSGMLSPDRRYFARLNADIGEIWLRDLRAPAQVTHFPLLATPDASRGEPLFSALAPGGTRIAVPSSGGTSIYALTSGDSSRIEPVHIPSEEGLVPLIFSDDGDTLICLRHPNAIARFDLRLDRLIGTIPTLVGRALTAEERARYELDALPKSPMH